VSDFKKKGMLLGRMWLPIKLTIEAEHLGNDKWQITYAETLSETPPLEDIALTIETAKAMGVEAKVEGNTVHYKVFGTRNQVFGIILGEALALSNVGNLTLREIFALASVGVPTIMEKAKYKETAK
jgi:hypothetical protein